MISNYDKEDLKAMARKQAASDDLYNLKQLTRDLTAHGFTAELVSGGESSDTSRCFVRLGTFDVGVVIIDITRSSKHNRLGDVKAPPRYRVEVRDWLHRKYFRSPSRYCKAYPSALKASIDFAKQLNEIAAANVRISSVADEDKVRGLEHAQFLLDSIPEGLEIDLDKVDSPDLIAAHMFGLPCSIVTKEESIFFDAFLTDSVRTKNRSIERVRIPYSDAVVMFRTLSKFKV